MHGMKKEKRCPVDIQAKHTMQAGKNFIIEIRKLRRVMNTCDTCINLDNCPIRQKINQQIQQAITEINEEFELQ